MLFKLLNILGASVNFHQLVAVESVHIALKRLMYLQCVGP